MGLSATRRVMLAIALVTFAGAALAAGGCENMGGIASLEPSIIVASPTPSPTPTPTPTPKPTSTPPPSTTPSPAPTLASGDALMVHPASVRF